MTQRATPPTLPSAVNERNGKQLDAGEKREQGLGPGQSFNSVSVRNCPRCNIPASSQALRVKSRMISRRFVFAMSRSRFSLKAWFCAWLFTLRFRRVRFPRLRTAAYHREERFQEIAAAQL